MNPKRQHRMQLQANNMQLAVNHALNDAAIARKRMAMLNPGALDGKRPQAWCEYGWKERVEFEDFNLLYRRGGLAFGIVDKVIGAIWKSAPWLIEGDEQDGSKKETKWEKSLKKAMTPQVWRWWSEADRRRLVGRYAGLLIHVKDGEAWDKPVTRKSSGIAKLTPAWAGSLKPTKFETDTNSQNYGLPTMWQYQEAAVNGAAGRTLQVHPDRIFIVGDYSDDAIGFLEPAFNAFVSIEKVEGGSGESFLKNAARQLSISFDKEIDLSNIAAMYGVKLEELHKKFNDAARDINMGNDTLLINQGATVNPLVADVPDPRPPYDVNLQTIAAATDTPAKIIVGMQTGERASSEDQKYFAARNQSRRHERSFEITEFVRHLIRIKVIDEVGEFTVMWDDLTEPTQADRLANAKVMSEINNTALASGEVVFLPEEVREAAGYDPLDVKALPDDVDEEDGSGSDSTQ